MSFYLIIGHCILQNVHLVFLNNRFEWFLVCRNSRIVKKFHISDFFPVHQTTTPEKMLPPYFECRSHASHRSSDLFLESMSLECRVVWPHTNLNVRKTALQKLFKMSNVCVDICYELFSSPVNWAKIIDGWFRDDGIKRQTMLSARWQCKICTQKWKLYIIIKY